MMFWQKEIETMSADQLAGIQLAKLKETVANCYDNVPYYRQTLDELGILPGDIRSLTDLSRLPFTKKDAFAQNYPFGLLARPMRDIVRFTARRHEGQAQNRCLYRKDLDTWTDCVARVLCAGGAGPDDIAQISFGYGLFTGAQGLHQGLDASAAPCPDVCGQHRKATDDYAGPGRNGSDCHTVLCAVLKRSRQTERPCRKLKLRLGFFGAEGCTPERAGRLKITFTSSPRTTTA